MSNRLPTSASLTELGIKLVKEAAGTILNSSTGIVSSETPAKVKISLGDIKELKPNETLANRVTCQRRS